MADNPANDPFTRAFDAIQSAFAGHAPFAGLVKPGNRINLRIIGQTQTKTNENAGDWPEEFLKFASFSGDIFEASSTTVKFTASYSVQIASGTVTTEVVARVWWESIRALFFAGPDLGLPELVQRWSVHRATPVKLTTYMDRQQWVAVLNISVMFAMTKNALAAYPAQNLQPLKR